MASLIRPALMKNLPEGNANSTRIKLPFQRSLPVEICRPRISDLRLSVRHNQQKNRRSKNRHQCRERWICGDGLDVEFEMIEWVQCRRDRATDIQNRIPDIGYERAWSSEGIVLFFHFDQLSLVSLPKSHLNIVLEVIRRTFQPRLEDSKMFPIYYLKSSQSPLSTGPCGCETHKECQFIFPNIVLSASQISDLQRRVNEELTLSSNSSLCRRSITTEYMDCRTLGIHQLHDCKSCGNQSGHRIFCAGCAGTGKLMCNYIFTPTSEIREDGVWREIGDLKQMSDTRLFEYIGQCSIVSLVPSFTSGYPVISESNIAHSGNTGKTNSKKRGVPHLRNPFLLQSLRSLMIKIDRFYTNPEIKIQELKYIQDGKILIEISGAGSQYCPFAGQEHNMSGPIYFIVSRRQRTITLHCRIPNCTPEKKVKIDKSEFDNLYRHL